MTDAALLPEPFQSKLVARSTRLLDVGQASGSLRDRLVEQELQHRRAATFFRGIGAVLGYPPVAGSLAGKANQSNYRFSKPDMDAVVRWMGDCLRISWIVLPKEQLGAIEVIVQLCPLLNTTPACCPDLARVREQCRRIARSR